MKQENKKNRASKHTQNTYNKNAHKNQGFSQVLQNFLSNIMIFFATNYTKMLFHHCSNSFWGRQHDSILVEDNDPKHRSKISIE